MTDNLPVPVEAGFASNADVLDIEDIQLPRARLAQATTPEVAAGDVRPGQWILPDGSTRSTLRGQVLAMRKTRALFVDDQLACFSLDGATATPREAAPNDVTGECDTCPYAKWVDRTPPLCRLSYEYVVALDDGFPVVVRFSQRSAWRQISQLNLALKTRGFGLTVELGATLVQKGSRKYYVPTIKLES